MLPAMSETSETATAHPGAQPENATGETLVLSVDDAAHIIGITPQAVRKRIAKGKLPAYREGRAWRVVLERGPIATDETATVQPRAHPSANPVAQPVQPQTAQLAALVEPFTTPLVAHIEALSREAERERGRAEAAERERDRLRAENERLQVSQDAATEHPAEQAPTEEPLRPGTWQRLRRRLRGE